MTWFRRRLLRTLLTLATMLMLLAAAAWSVRDGATVARATLNTLERPAAAPAAQRLLGKAVGENLAAQFASSPQVREGLRTASAGEGSGVLRDAVYSAVTGSNPDVEQLQTLGSVMNLLGQDDTATQVSPVVQQTGSIGRLGQLHPVRWALANTDIVLPIGALVVGGALGVVVLTAGRERGRTVASIGRWGLWAGGLPLGLLLVVLPITNWVFEKDFLAVAGVFLPTLFSKAALLWGGLVAGGASCFLLPRFVRALSAVAGGRQRVEQGDEVADISGEAAGEALSFAAFSDTMANVELFDAPPGAGDVCGEDLGGGEDVYPRGLLKAYQRAQ